MVSLASRQGVVHSQRIISITVILCAVVVKRMKAADSTTCGDGWIENAASSSYCYNVAGDPMDWPDAKIACIMEGGNLATISDPIDMEYLEDVLGRQNATLFWAGGRNDGGSWVWPDGTAFDFTNWDTNQHPDNRSTGCMAVDSQTALWQSRDCTEALKPICQKTDPSAPTLKPTTNMRTTRKATPTKHQTTRKATPTKHQTTRKATTTKHQTTRKATTTKHQTTRKATTTKHQTTRKATTTKHQTTRKATTTTKHQTTRKATTTKHQTTRKATTTKHQTTRKATTTKHQTTRKATTTKHQTTRKATPTKHRTTRKATTTTTKHQTTRKSATSNPRKAITSRTLEHKSTTTSMISPSAKSKTRQPMTSQPTTRVSSTQDGTKNSHSSDDGNTGLPTAGIVVIVIGVVILLVSVGVVLHIRVLKRRNNSSSQDGGFDNTLYTDTPSSNNPETMALSQMNQ